MELYLLRHGEADWPDWNKSDDERPLTKRGKKEMQEVAKFLGRLKVRPDLIVTSPLPRASQTAEIAADYLKANHEPDFTTVISGLTGASLKLSKAGVALLDVDPESEEGKLLWLFPPKFSRKSK